MSVRKAEKQDQLKSYRLFWGCGGWRGGGVKTWKTLGEGANFVWVIHTRLGGGLLVTAFQHGRVLTEPLTQHIVIIILLLTHF